MTILGATCVALSLVSLTVWLPGKGNDDAGIANVLALPVTVLGAVAAAYGLRSRPRTDDPAVLAAQARTLLVDASTAEARTLAQLLGDTGDPLPADVEFAQPGRDHLREHRDEYRRTYPELNIKADDEEFSA